MRAGHRFIDSLRRIEDIISTHRGADVDGIPLVTVSDVLDLVDNWTQQLRSVVDELDAADQLLARWARVVNETVSMARALAPDDDYPGRVRVFLDLRYLARRFDQAVAARLADGLQAGWRNATMEVKGGALNIDHVTDWVDLVNAMARFFVEKHGSIAEPNPQNKDRVRVQPQTTVAEVLWLADFWTKRLAELGSRRLADTDVAITKWRTVVSHMTEVVKGKQGEDTYPENWAYWSGLRDFVGAIDLAREDAVSPSWNLSTILEGIGYAVEKSAEAVVHGAEAGVKKSYDVIKTVGTDALGGAEKVLGDATKPVLIGGAVLLGLAIVVPLVTRK